MPATTVRTRRPLRKKTTTTKSTTERKRAPLKRAGRTAPKKKAIRTSRSGKTSAAGSYDKFKQYQGAFYTGMQVGRSHKWNYDKGVWQETKVTPDQWELSYNVIKRRAGRAPEGSGVPVGTGYHWFILAHQYVEKLNANDYTTSMVGIKYKMSHKRASTGKWNSSDTTQRKHLIAFLKNIIAEIENDPVKSATVPLDFLYKHQQYTGIAIPVMSSCENGVCRRLDVTLNNKHIGMIRCTKNGWRITGVPQAFVNAIGHEIFLWYE